MKNFKHIQLNECSSTQSELRKTLMLADKKEDYILITTESQTSGHGRSGHTWTHFSNALAFSFTLEPNFDQLSLTPLEIAVLLESSIKKHFNTTLSLKWPNDLINMNGLKCGGIICQGPENGKLLVGVGINFGNCGQEITPGEQFKSGFGQLFPDRELSLSDHHHFPALLYRELIHNRLSAKEVIREWQKKCIHLNKPVQIDEGQLKTQGTFIGLGNLGEALIQTGPNDKIKSVFSGNLNFYFKD